MWPFGGKDAEEKRRLERDLAAHTKALQRAERHIDDLQRAREAAESRYRQESIEKEAIIRQHGDKILLLTKEHARSMENTRQEHEHYVKSLQLGHNNNVERLKAEHNKEVSQLVGQLLVNQDDNQGWPDDKLKINFRELQRLIESVTSPRNKEFLIPSNHRVGSRLDPTSFLDRAGRGKSHLLLKSTIWAILREQFFCAPFGFGALGPDIAHRELTNVYTTWRKLFDKPPRRASSTGEDFAIFQQDKLANKWRSANFQCISVALRGSGSANPAPDSLLSRLNADNIRQTVDRIMAILSEVSRLSNVSVRTEIEDQIRQLVDLAREISLQFGVQTAQLRLSVPNRGDEIQIGEEFHDCEDGDCYRGSTCTIALVIVPGLQKIGDGRSDMSSKRIIVPCEIFSHEPPS